MLKFSNLTSSILHQFLDKMTYNVTQTDRANSKTLYCDSNHLNPYPEVHLKFSDTDSA